LAKAIEIVRIDMSNASKKLFLNSKAIASSERIFWSLIGSVTVLILILTFTASSGSSERFTAGATIILAVATVWLGTKTRDAVRLNQREMDQNQKLIDLAQSQANSAAQSARILSESSRPFVTIETKKLYIEAMEAAAAAKNADLDEQTETMESLLKDSLSISVAVNLEELRTRTENPAFSAPEFETPMPAPQLIVVPPEPQFVEPVPAKGISAAFGGKRHHEEAVAAATKSFEEEHRRWQEEASKIPAIQLGQMQAHQRYEADRLEKLANARQTYDAECAKRDEEDKNANRELDELIEGLTRNEKDAIQTYVSIVLETFPYPDKFPVEHEYSFDPELKELTLAAKMPGPSTVPAVREYKYNKTKDEIVATNSTLKQLKDRYAMALYSVALRSLHEIFEADEDGHIQTVALTVETEDADPATGLTTRASLLSVAVDRETFRSYDLTKVVPLATLQHMKALISKSPFDMLAIDQSRGVRNRGT
jgi:restriction system protein